MKISFWWPFSISLRKPEVKTNPEIELTSNVVILSVWGFQTIKYAFEILKISQLNLELCVKNMFWTAIFYFPKKPEVDFRQLYLLTKTTFHIEQMPLEIRKKYLLDLQLLAKIHF